MNYKVLNKQRFTKENYSIVPIRMEDRYIIMKWRNEQIYHLRQEQGKPLTEKDQDAYFNIVIARLFEQERPTQILFSYLENDVCIGYGGLVHISWTDKRAELSFLVNTIRTANETKYGEDFYNFIELMKELCFTEMKFNRLFTETYAFRTFHISILEYAGLKEEGRLRQNIFEKDKYYDSIFHSILTEEYNEK